MAKLGIERSDQGLDAGHPLPVLEHELPDSAAVIAANLVIDGILTTFVASTRDSSIEPLAQRARKILQEEGAHRVHAEAWLRRMCRGGASDRELLLQRIKQTWHEASRWPGPSDHPGYAAAINEGMVAEGPEDVRRRVRDWLSGLLAAEQAEVVLEDPTDWAGWDEHLRR